MEGSATKVLERNDYDANIRKSRIVSRIYVEGYDTWLSGYDFVASMREHFSSCGEVMHVYIPGYTGYVAGTTLNRFALIYLRGEGAEEKALQLSGSYSRGHKLVVESYPFHAKHLDHKFAPTRFSDNIQHHPIVVDGYDTGLPLEHVKRSLYEQLSKCGRVMISLCEIGGSVYSHAYVTLVGIDTVEKLLQLSGSDEEGWENLNFSRVDCPNKDRPGACTIPPAWSLYPPYSSNTTTSVMALASIAPEDPNLPKPPCMTSLLPYPWIYRVDSGTGYGCLRNTENGVEVEVPPSLLEPSSRVCYAPEDPNLPKPWKGLVDLSTGYGYFWNTETNVTQYQRPYSSPSSEYLLGLIPSFPYQRG